MRNITATRHCPDFYIRVLNTGVASWVVQWKRLGRQKKIALGDVLVLDRPEAIKAAQELTGQDTTQPTRSARSKTRADARQQGDIRDLRRHYFWKTRYAKVNCDRIRRRFGGNI